MCVCVCACGCVYLWVCEHVYVCVCLCVCVAVCCMYLSWSQLIAHHAVHLAVTVQAKVYICVCTNDFPYIQGREVGMYRVGRWVCTG